MNLFISAIGAASSAIYTIPTKVGKKRDEINKIISGIAHTKLPTTPPTPRALRTAAEISTNEEGFVVFPSLIEPLSDERVCDSDEEQEGKLDSLIQEYKALFSPKGDVESDAESDNDEVYV